MQCVCDSFRHLVSVVGCKAEAEEFDRLSCQGKASLGWLMLKQAVELAKDLDLFKHPNGLHRPRREISPEMERVRAITAWGIFSLNLLVASPGLSQKDAG